MKKKWIIFGVVFLVLVVGGMMVGPIMSKVEQPSYQVTLSTENIEIQGERESSVSHGFRLLADYILEIIR
jgi:hypothetical protein